MDSPVHSGLRWLQRSGVQAASGAVFSDYQAAARSYGAVSSAAAAWHAHALLTLGLASSDEGFVDIDDQRRDQAVLTGRFLMENAFDLTADLFVTSPDAPQRLADFFSGGVIVRALLALYRASHDMAYLECAERCGRSLQMRLARVDGSYFPGFDLETNQPLDGEPGVEQLRVALAFLELAETAGLGELRSAAELTLGWALIRHEATLTEPEADALLTMRRYALFLEGLLPFLDRFDASNALQFGMLELDARMRQLPELSRPPELIAQLLRLRLFADTSGMVELDHELAERDAYRLSAYQVRSHNPCLDGAFATEPEPPEATAVLRTVPTILCLQALEMWEQARDGGFRQTWHDLL